MSTDKPSKRVEVADDTQLISGIQKHLSNVSLIVNGTSYAEADLVKQVQGRVDAVNTTITNRATWQAAVKAEKEQLSASQPFLNALRKALYTMFPTVDDLADFGLAPHKKPVITPAERVAAAAKAKATRAARHTMGSKQKKAITGKTAVAPPADPGIAPVAPQAARVAAPAAFGTGTPHA